LEFEEVVVNLIAGFAGPLLYVSYAIGFVVYFNHTHPEIKWTNSFGEDAFVERHTSSTVDLKFRGISAFLLPNKVMSHLHIIWIVDPTPTFTPSAGATHR
jgi:hypothetical protein